MQDGPLKLQPEPHASQHWSVGEPFITWHCFAQTTYTREPIVLKCPWLNTSVPTSFSVGQHNFSKTSNTHTVGGLNDACCVIVVFCTNTSWCYKKKTNQTLSQVGDHTLSQVLAPPPGRALCCCLPFKDVEAPTQHQLIRKQWTSVFAGGCKHRVSNAASLFSPIIKEIKIWKYLQFEPTVVFWGWETMCRRGYCKLLALLFTVCAATRK